MPVSAPEIGEGAKDEVAGDPVGCDYKAALLDRILYQNLAVNAISQPGGEFGIGHRTVDSGMPPQVPEPAPGENTDPVRQTEEPNEVTPSLDQGHLFRHSPTLINPDRGEEEELSSGSLEEGNSFEMVDTGGFPEEAEGLTRRQRPAHGTVDTVLNEVIDERACRVRREIEIR